MWPAATQIARLPFGREVFAARFSPSGTDVAVAGGRPAAAVWTPVSGDVRELKGHPGKLYNLAWRPGGKQLVTAGVDGSVRVWDVASAKQVQAFAGNHGGAYSAEFSPAGDLVISAGLDRVARVWDVVSGKEVRTLTGHSDVLADAAFSPDGDEIVTAGDDHLGLLWDATESDAIELNGAHETLLSAALQPRRRGGHDRRLRRDRALLSRRWRQPDNVRTRPRRDHLARFR